PEKIKARYGDAARFRAITVRMPSLPGLGPISCYRIDPARGAARGKLAAPFCIGSIGPGSPGRVQTCGLDEGECLDLAGGQLPAFLCSSERPRWFSSFLLFCFQPMRSSGEIHGAGASNNSTILMRGSRTIPMGASGVIANRATGIIVNEKGPPARR